MSCLSRIQPPLQKALAAGDVFFSLCRLDDDADIALETAWDILSSAETTRAARFRYERDRSRFVRGRAFMRSVLGATTDQDPARLALTQIGNGKPFLNNQMHFNLSHSGDLAVLAMSASGPVGIDLEFIDRHIDIPALARSCFNEDEEQSILAIPVPEQAERFFAFWTAKEAHMKLTGQGMSLPPREIALDLRDGYPVGYLRPASPFATLTYIDLGLPSAMCCLALASQNSDSFFT